MTDGSVINGEIISFANGVYAINTANFGEIKIGAEKVSKIESANYVSTSTTISPILQADNPIQSQISTYEQTLMNNPENAAIVTGLTSNNRLQEMAKDPQIQNAAKRGDIQSLLGNPKFMEVVNSPEVQEAVKKINK